ncbi:serine protease Hayan-like [Amphibalanus amphitrite]|uniref:serine protease Hayan-like n=1 Tax=Amphibalanus amphitrite TaxID=1232801 RepID=UPI001C9150D9|nr:serine protease Hayan-like [Amphibalanus amphitrite]
MRLVVLALLLCVGAPLSAAFVFPSGGVRRGVVVMPLRACRANDGTEGRCVSMVSGVCPLYRTTTDLLLRKPSICALSFRDAIVCCPLAALIGTTGGVAPAPRTTARPRVFPGFTIRPTTARPVVTAPPTAPPVVTSAPPVPSPRPVVTNPPVVTRPTPTRVTSPAPSTPPPVPSATPETRPTPRSVPPTRDLLSPIGLRPRPTPAAATSAPITGPRRGFRQPGCGTTSPIPAFHASGDYFQRPPPFARAERVHLGLQPWMAMVGERNSERAGADRWICAGALLTPRIVLTSAQCVLTPDEPERLVVGLGEHDLASRTDGVAGTHPVAAVELHPQWSQPERRHSLAVLLLGRPPDESPLIRPVCLPPPDPPAGAAQLLPFPGSTVVEASYNLDTTGLSDGSARQRLVAGEVPVQPLGRCVAALAGAPLAELLFPGGPQPEPDLCLAAGHQCAQDVGAPAVAAGEDGTIQLEGLQLMGSCAAGQPRLLLRVRHYVPFIADAIEKLTKPSSAGF